MRKLLFVTLLGVGVAFTYSCEKEECKTCYTIEAEGTLNEITTLLGERCGEDLEAIDGKTYQGSQTPVRVYCE